jgi:uncharacterized membrane protein
MNSELNLLFLRYPIVIIIFITGYIAPFLTKKNILFGARIPDEYRNSHKIEQLKRDYKHLYMVIMVPVLIILMFLLYSISDNSVITIGIFLQVFLNFYIQVLFNHKVKKIKKTLVQNDATDKEQTLIIDTNFRGGNYLVPVKWFLPSIVIILLNIVYTAQNFNKIPAMIPSRFDFSGKVFQFIYKSNLNVYYLSFISIFNLVMFLSVYYGIKRSKQDLNSSFPQQAILQDRQNRYLWSVYFVILAFLLTVYFTIISLHVNRMFILPDELFTIINIAFPNLVLISTVFLAVKTGQSGSRLKVETKEAELKTNFKDDDINWKLGMFYFNPDDPAIMIPKRMGVGWTLNFGHPISFIIIGAVIFIPQIIKKFSH